MPVLQIQYPAILPILDSPLLQLHLLLPGLHAGHDLIKHFWVLESVLVDAG